MANLCTADIIIPPDFLNSARESLYCHIEKIFTDAHCRAVFSGAGQLWATDAPTYSDQGFCPQEQGIILL